MMTKIPEVLKRLGKKVGMDHGCRCYIRSTLCNRMEYSVKRAVAPQELPGEARSFIAQHYPEENSRFVIKTLDELAVTYKVVFCRRYPSEISPKWNVARN